MIVYGSFPVASGNEVSFMRMQYLQARLILGRDGQSAVFFLALETLDKTVEFILGN